MGAELQSPTIALGVWLVGPTGVAGFQTRYTMMPTIPDPPKWGEPSVSGPAPVKMSQEQMKRTAAEKGHTVEQLYYTKGTLPDLLMFIGVTGGIGRPMNQPLWSLSVAGATLDHFGMSNIIQIYPTMLTHAYPPAISSRARFAGKINWSDRWIFHRHLQDAGPSLALSDATRPGDAPGISRVKIDDFHHRNLCIILWPKSVGQCRKHMKTQMLFSHGNIRCYLWHIRHTHCINWLATGLPTRALGYHAIFKHCYEKPSFLAGNYFLTNATGVFFRCQFFDFQKPMHACFFTWIISRYALYWLVNSPV